MVELANFLLIQLEIGVLTLKENKRSVNYCLTNKCWLFIIFYWTRKFL